MAIARSCSATSSWVRRRSAQISCSSPFGIIGVPILDVTRNASVVDQPGEDKLIRLLLLLNDLLCVVVVSQQAEFLLG